MDEDQRSREAQQHIADETDHPTAPDDTAQPPAPRDAPSRSPRPAWFEVGLVVALPLAGFFIARLSGLLVGALLAAVLVVLLRTVSKP